jgi:hypothetical protein
MEPKLLYCLLTHFAIIAFCTAKSLWKEYTLSTMSKMSKFILVNLYFCNNVKDVHNGLDLSIKSLALTLSLKSLVLALALDLIGRPGLNFGLGFGGYV